MPHADSDQDAREASVVLDSRVRNQRKTPDQTLNDSYLVMGEVIQLNSTATTWVSLLLLRARPYGGDGGVVSQRPHVSFPPKC